MNPACEFWVIYHHHQGKPLKHDDSCPYCAQPLLEVSPPPPGEPTYAPVASSSIDGRQFVTASGKIVLNRVEKYAREHGLERETVMQAARQHCVPCQQKAVS